MSPNAFLDSTPREFEALTAVWFDSKRLQAQAIADYRNVHFREDSSPAWTQDHVFGFEQRSDGRRIPTREELLKWRNYQAPAKPRELPEWARTSVVGK